MQLSRTYLVPFCALLFGALCAVVYVYYSPSFNKESPQKKWEHRIAAVGAPAAYKEFADEVVHLSQQKQHLQAHDFGGALYKELGIPGLSVCDSRFSWGCYHEFIGRAIEDRGEDVIPYLRDTCLHMLRETPNACVHAIGHGILAYAGYSKEALDQALKMCDLVPNISPNHPTTECFRGVFMEFNFKSMLAVEGGLRPLTDAGLNYPCNQLEGAQQRACYYVQSQWWIHLTPLQKTDRSATTTLAIIGKRCSTLGSKDLRDACFGGIGTTIAWELNRAPKLKSALCDVISPNTSDQLLCKLNLAFWIATIMNTEPPDKQYPRKDACVGLQGYSYATCLAWAHGNAGPAEINR